MVTKGYGFTVDDIDWSCPADLEPYAKAYKLRLKEKDTFNWYLGQYFMSALDATICNNGLWRKKGAKPHNYIEKPIMCETEEWKTDNKPLTEEEKKRKTEQLFLNLRIMGANFNLNHKN